MVDPCFWPIRSTQYITNNSQFYSTHNKCVFVVLLVPTYNKHRRQSSRIIWKNIQEFVRVRQAAPMLLLLLKQCSAAQKKSCPPKCSILFGARCLSLFFLLFLGRKLSALLLMSHMCPAYTAHKSDFFSLDFFLCA